MHACTHAGRQLFQEALANGHMSGFFKLMEQFSTQDEPAFCGLTSLTMVLNALAIDPRRIWKGAWRWFNETMLDCCQPLEAVRKEGITLQQVGWATPGGQVQRKSAGQPLDAFPPRTRACFGEL